VIVEGALIFADNGPITFDVKYFIIKGGYLEIGNESTPY
jgi:hypothetical protein